MGEFKMDSEEFLCDYCDRCRFDGTYTGTDGNEHFECEAGPNVFIDPGFTDCNMFEESNND